MTAAPAPIRRRKPDAPVDPKVAYRDVARRFHMAADPTRLQVFLFLEGGPMHVGALREAIGGSQPGLSHHMALMALAGVVEAERRGQRNFYALTEAGRVLLDAVRPLLEEVGDE